MLGDETFACPVEKISSDFLKLIVTLCYIGFEI